MFYDNYLLVAISITDDLVQHLLINQPAQGYGTLFDNCFADTKVT